MAEAKKRDIRFTKAPLSKKVKMGGRAVVSEALVKKGSTNLVPKVHVRSGDTVVLIKGFDADDIKPEKLREGGRSDQSVNDKIRRRQTRMKGKIGKVLKVFPRSGKILVEGVNLIARATRQRTPMGKSGIIEAEHPIYAAKVMLYCTPCKKPTRIKHKVLDSGKKVRICKHCGDSLDT